MARRFGGARDGGGGEEREREERRRVARRSTVHDFAPRQKEEEEGRNAGHVGLTLPDWPTGLAAVIESEDRVESFSAPNVRADSTRRRGRSRRSTSSRLRSDRSDKTTARGRRIGRRQRCTRSARIGSRRHNPRRHRARRRGLRRRTKALAARAADTSARSTCRSRRRIPLRRSRAPCSPRSWRRRWLARDIRAMRRSRRSCRCRSARRRPSVRCRSCRCRCRAAKRPATSGRHPHPRRDRRWSTRRRRTRRTEGSAGESAGFSRHALRRSALHEPMPFTRRLAPWRMPRGCAHAWGSADALARTPTRSPRLACSSSE